MKARSGPRMAQIWSAVLERFVMIGAVAAEVNLYSARKIVAAGIVRVLALSIAIARSRGRTPTPWQPLNGWMLPPDSSPPRRPVTGFQTGLGFARRRQYSVEALPVAPITRGRHDAS